MENDDKGFEEYLSEFEPRKPRALPSEDISKRVWLRRFAAAATIAIALGTSLWYARKKNALNRGEFAAKTAIVTPDTKSAPQPLSLLPLTKLALEKPEQLDAELARASRRVLPDFRGSESTLRVLAKE
jgi:hypothetical protein